jgi:hypothetical protein
VLVRSAHGLVLAVWIASAAFAATDAQLEETSKGSGGFAPERGSSSAM